MDAIAPHVSPVLAPTPIERLESNPRLTEEQKIAEASRQFEAVLLRQIISAARRTVIESDFESRSTASDIYEDMVNYSLAEAISQSGAFGVARALEAQLRSRRPASAEPSAVSGSPESSAPARSAESPGTAASPAAETASLRPDDSAAPAATEISARAASRFRVPPSHQPPLIPTSAHSR
jgi:flagellar protein FlgJ